MSDNTLTVTEVVNSVTVTPVNNTVTVSEVGTQGPAGPTGATGATGATGSSGVVTVNAPITNAGTSTAANLSVSTGTTSAVGVLQLTDSVSSTSTTTAATPNAVKTAYDSSLIKGVQLPYRAGLYYKTPNAQYGTQTISNQVTYYTPIFVNTSNTFDRIACTTQATFSGTSTVRLGIYSDSAGSPSTLILDAGTVTPAATATVYQITISQTLATGFYWLAFCQQGTAPTTAAYVGNANSQSVSNLLIAANTTPTGNQLAGFFQLSVTGAFANAGTLTATTGAPFVYIRSA